MSKFSSGSITWALIGVEVVAMGVGAWLGPEAGIYVASAGLLLFVPLVKEWIDNRSRSANADQSLGIIHGEGKPYLQHNSSVLKRGPDRIYGKLYTYRVGIGNNSDFTVNDVEVKLTSIKECPTTFHGIGGNLHWMHDNDEPPSLLKKSIPPTRQRDYSDAVFVDVILCFWPDKPEERTYQQLEVWHIVPGVSRIVSFRDYDLVVTAIGPDGQVVPAKLRLETQVDEPPTLKLIN